MEQIGATTLATVANHLILANDNSLDTPATDDGFNGVLKTGLDDDNEISRFSRSQLTFAAIMTIIIMIIGIFGNILTTVALLKCPKVRNVAAAFIISLCIADCIFCAAVLPFNAFRFIEGTWTHGDFLCKLVPFIQYGNIGVSLLCIAMITINRYIMIAHHTSYAKIYKRHWIGAMIVFCWVFSYGMQLPTLLSVWGRFGYDEKLGTCSILPDRFGRSSKSALFAIAFVTPCIIIVACYAKIFWVVHESEARMRKHAHKQNSVPNNMRPVPSTSTTVNGTTSNAGGVRASQVSTSSFDNTNSGVGAEPKLKSIRIKDHRDARAKRNEWRITKMVLAIFLSFVACYSPITIVKVLDRDVHWPGFHIFGYIMLYLSACINPIIYVIMNKQYRQAYKTVLTCKPTRLLPFNGGSSNGEKWKDIGFKFDNHSRTMVSQVSLAEPNSISSISHSNQLQPHVKLNTVEHINTTAAKSQQQYTNNNNNISIHPDNTFLNIENPTNSNRAELLHHQSSSSSYTPFSRIEEANNQNGHLSYNDITQSKRINWLKNTRPIGDNNNSSNTIDNINHISHNSAAAENKSLNHPLQQHPSITVNHNNNNTLMSMPTAVPIFGPLNPPIYLPQLKTSAQLEIPPSQNSESMSEKLSSEASQSRPQHHPLSSGTQPPMGTNPQLQRPPFIQRHGIQRPGMRITLDEEDVILEEEEPASISQTSSSVKPVSTITPVSQSTTTTEKPMNSNSNDIPDSTAAAATAIPKTLINSKANNGVDLSATNENRNKMEYDNGSARLKFLQS